MKKEFNLRKSVMNAVNEICDAYLKVNTYFESVTFPDCDYPIDLVHNDREYVEPNADQVEQLRVLYDDLVNQITELSDVELRYAYKMIYQAMNSGQPFSYLPFLRELAKRKDADAVCDLAYEYYLGNEAYGLFIDRKRSKALYRRAIELGSSEAKDMYNAFFVDDDNDDDSVYPFNYTIEGEQETIAKIKTMLDTLLTLFGDDCGEMGVFIPLQFVFAALVRSTDYRGNIREYHCSENKIIITLETPLCDSDPLKYALLKRYDVKIDVEENDL